MSKVMIIQLETVVVCLTLNGNSSRINFPGRVKYQTINIYEHTHLLEHTLTENIYIAVELRLLNPICMGIPDCSYARPIAASMEDVEQLAYFRLQQVNRQHAAVCSLLIPHIGIMKTELSLFYSKEQ